MPRDRNNPKTLYDRKQAWLHYGLAALCVLLNPTPKADRGSPCTANLAIETSGETLMNLSDNVLGAFHRGPKLLDPGVSQV